MFLLNNTLSFKNRDVGHSATSCQESDIKNKYLIVVKYENFEMVKFLNFKWKQGFKKFVKYDLKLYFFKITTIPLHKMQIATEIIFS